MAGGRKKSKKSIKLAKGTLRRHGYATKKSRSARTRALCSAVKHVGYNVVSKKLTALQTLNKNKNPRLSRQYANDREIARNCQRYDNL